MEFRLLGQLEVLHAGESMTLRGRKLRTLLAVLLLNANRPVSVERLVDALWEDRPPDSARPTLQYFVHRLRKSLSNTSGRDDLLITQAGGYLLRIKPGDLDIERFRRELARARDARDQGDLEGAAVGYERALSLWRGPALADFAEEAFAQGEIARLEEMRLTAIEEDADVRLALGRHAELVGELEGLVRAHTLRERLLGQLILALYRSGRQVEALGTYRAARRRLVTELGIEPGTELQRLERAILAQDPELELQPFGSVATSDGAAASATGTSATGTSAASAADVPPSAPAEGQPSGQRPASTGADAGATTGPTTPVPTGSTSAPGTAPDRRPPSRAAASHAAPALPRGSPEAPPQGRGAGQRAARRPGIRPAASTAGATAGATAGTGAEGMPGADPAGGAGSAQPAASAQAASGQPEAAGHGGEQAQRPRAVGERGQARPARGAAEPARARGQRSTGTGGAAEPARSRRRQPAGRQRRAERKLITVLVAGVVETAPDPEDLRAKHAAALQRIRHEVERHGGMVYAAIGGTVLSAFGIPRTREDDPERAVRAALRIASGGPVRVGVDTGEAVVAPAAGSMGAFGLPSGLGTEATLVAGIAGTVVDSASALLSLTAPGAVLVGPATYRSTNRVIEYPAGPSVGDIWQPIAPRSRTGAVVYEPSGERRSPLIEREGDLGLLQSLLVHVRSELGPQLVTVVGAAGIGKTRLVGELGQLIEADPELITWRQGRSVPADNLGERTAFRAFAEILRAHTGIQGSDDAEAIGARLHRAVVDAIGEPEEAAAVEQQLRPLVGLDGTDRWGDDRRETFAAWARFIEGLAADRPLALVFEDLQWADDAMLEFVEDLVDLVGPVPLLVVATARPELLERRRDWGGGKRNAVIVSLTPLSERGSARLLDTRLNLAGLSMIPPRTRKLLLARSGGNPLFLEEYVRMLQDEPRRMTAAPLPIPQSIQQLITSRLDALEPEDKALLEDLAVLGEANWAEPLVAVSGMDREQVLDGLRRLERRELLRRTRTTSSGGEHGYAFRHALIRDVAYGQLLRADRAERHHRAAEWLERHGDSVSERADLLARHYENVLDLTKEHEDVVDAARVAFRTAGDRAAALGALATAAHWYRRALALWPLDSPDRPDLLLRLGGALVFSAHTGEELLVEARQAFEALGDTARARAADRYLAQLNWFRGRAEQALEHGARAAAGERSLSDQARDLPWLGALGALLSCDYAGAIRGAEEVAERGRAAGSDEMVGVGAALAGTARLFTGDPDGADEAEEGIRTLAASGSPGVAFFQVGLAEALWWWGDLKRCEQTLAAVMESVPDTSPEALWAGSTRTLLDYAAGRWDDVLRFVDAALGGKFAGTLGYQESTCRMARARIRFGRGDLEGALVDARAAVDRATTAGNRRNLSVALALTGRILLTGNERTEAVACLDELLQDAHEQRNAMLPSGDLVSLLVDLGRTDDMPTDLPPTRWLDAAVAFVRRDFQRAAAVYAEIGSRPDEAVTRLRAAFQLASDGRPGEALGEARQMSDFSRRAGSTVGVAVSEAAIAGLEAALAAEPAAANGP